MFQLTGAINQAQSVGGTPLALMSGSFVLENKLVGTIHNKFFISANFSSSQKLQGVRYYASVYVGNRFAVYCAMELKGEGRRLSGKIAADIQKPYLGGRIAG